MISKKNRIKYLTLTIKKYITVLAVHIKNQTLIRNVQKQNLCYKNKVDKSR